MRDQSARSCRVPQLRSPAGIELLETRRLLSTINWVNEGNDNFIFFGANQAVARTIVQRAIGDWERVVADFNYDDTGPNLNNTFDLTINAASLGFTERGTTTITGRDDATDRKPTSASVTLDDDGGGLGWYFDPNVGFAFSPEDGEYTQPTTLFSANIAPGGPSGSDFYRTILHEIGHAMGIARSTTHILKIADFMVDSGFNDPLDSGADLMTLNTFGGPAPEYTVTTNGGVHLWEGDGAGGINLPEHPNELLNPGRTVPGGVNRRQLISETDGLLLLDVYNYQITRPNDINTFAANVDEAAGVLTINGDLVPGFANDLIDIEHGGIETVVELTDGNLAREAFVEVAYQTIVINAGNGNDLVEINELPAGKSVTVNLGAGDDDTIFAGEPRYMSSILSNVAVNGGTGTDDVAYYDDGSTVGRGWTLEAGSTRWGPARTFTLGSIESQHAFASGSHDNFFIHATPAGSTLSITGNAGNELFDIVQEASLGGAVTCVGGVGDDFIRLSSANGGDNLWTFTAGAVAKSGAHAVNYTTLETIYVSGGAQRDVFDVSAATAQLNLDGGPGDDTFNIGQGTLNLLSRVTVIGSDGTDLLLIDDTLDAGEDQYVLGTAIMTKPNAGGTFQAIEIGTQIGNEIENTVLRANNAANLITVNSARGLEIRAGGGNDVIFVNDNVNAFPVLIDGGSGQENVFLNQDGIGTVTAAFDTTQDLFNLELLAGSTLRVAAGSNATVLVASSLALTANSLLDLNDNTMIVRAAASGGNTDLYRQRIATGHNGGAWNGTQGITSTSARLSGVGDGIGYGTAVQLGASAVNGFPVTGLDVVLDHTLYGDTNLDHVVNLSDFNRLAGNFGQSATAWPRGDFNYDNITNLLDFNRLAGNFGGAAASPAIVPQGAYGKHEDDRDGVPL